MLVVSTITEINYVVVGQFYDLVWLFSYFFLWLHYLLCFRHIEKSVCAFSRLIHYILEGSYQAKSLYCRRFSSGKIFSSQIDGSMVLF